MADLVLPLVPETQERLEALAAKMGRSVDECLQMAVAEFLEHWEDYLRSVDDLSDEERVSLRVVNDE